MTPRRLAKRAACISLLTVVAILVLSGLVMVLWNALIPDLFNGPLLTYWQAAGVLLLSHILLRCTPLYGVRTWRHARRRRRWKQRLASMTPEERAAFRMELGLTKADGIPGG